MNRNRPAVDAQGLLNKLAALSDSEFSVLQNAYYFRWVQMTLRSNGWINLLLGGLTLFLGLSGLQFGLLKVIQALLGAAIVGVSLWGLASPSRQTIFGYSILFALCGAWNLFLGVRDGVFSAGILLTLFGIFQIRWAYQFYQTYTQRIPLATSKPSKETVTEYDGIWREFALTRYAHSDQLLEVSFGRNRWRGFIFGDHVAFADPKRKLVVFARKSEFEFDTNQADSPRQKLRGKFKVNTLVSKATMQSNFYERYFQWKTAK